MSTLPSAAPVVLAEPVSVASPTLAGDPAVATRSAGADAAILTIGTYAAQVLLFVAGLAQRALLGPAGAGYWALMQTFWALFSIAPLGATHGATRQVPDRRGRGDFDGAAGTAGASASFSLVMYALAGLLVALVAIVAGSGWAPELRFGLVLLGVTAPLRHLGDLHVNTLQAVKRFDVASATLIVQAVATLLLQTLAIYLFGFYGLFVGIVAVQLAAFALWFKTGVISRRRPAFRLHRDRARVRELIRFGAPLLVYAQVSQLLQAADTLVVGAALDVTQLGYYALAWSVTMYVLFLPTSISAALFPRMMERYAETGELTSIRHYAIDVQRVLAYALVPLAVGAAYFSFPVVIRHALPDFVSAVGVVQIMVAATFFAALISMPVKVLIAAGERWSLSLMMLICVGTSGTLTYLAVAVLDRGIKGAAVATAISYGITLMLTSGYCLRRMMPARRVALHLAEILVGFAYMYAALRLVTAVAGGSTPAGLVADAGLALAQLAVFVVLMSPWLWLAERRTGGLSSSWRLFSDRRRRRAEETAGSGVGGAHE